MKFPLHDAYPRELTHARTHTRAVKLKSVGVEVENGGVWGTKLDTVLRHT